jgi:hypothetical protein
MNNLTVSKTKDHFENDGKKFFYLADTVWSAFTNISAEEWEEYLEYRSCQGFNVLQISILPIMKDASESELNILPFNVNSRGLFEYGCINEEYFERAGKMLERAAAKGFIPALVVLWLDYVPDTWGSNREPEAVMPLDLVKPYTEYIISKFSKYNPIYIISGDTDFQSDKTQEHYLMALKTVKEMQPGALTTMHLCGSYSYLPEAIEQSSWLDFYIYQSSHGFDNQDQSYKLAKNFMEKPIKRPVLNSEPCYEGHGHGGKYGRFNEFDVRKAVWQSLLSGEKAGVAYGAHGIWSWHKRHLAFNNGEFSGTPFDWRSALRLNGAWDVAFAKWVYEANEMFDLQPADIIMNETREIRASASKDFAKIAIYVPYSTDVKVNCSLSSYKLKLINMTDRYVVNAKVMIEDGVSIIKMHEFNSDVLIIAEK